MRKGVLEKGYGARVLRAGESSPMFFFFLKIFFLFFIYSCGALFRPHRRMNAIWVRGAARMRLSDEEGKGVLESK